nr:integrase, catalytic region, zinc finger, CCHC-type, peptidase aspartic, catalytic [Tanacetum cinerariifolium]
AKKDKDEQVFLAEDQAWMESSSDSDQQINTNMVFMAQIKKVLSDSEASSSSADEKISENDDDQEIFHDAIESASENFTENHIDSQKDYDKSDVDHNDSEEKDHFVDKLIRKFNKKIVKCQKRIEKSNQQSKDFENQNKDLQDKYDTLLVVLEDLSKAVLSGRKKGSSNTSNVDLSYVSHSKLNKDIKRYTRKDLLSCNRSHLGETSSSYVCNDAMDVSCNSRLCDSFDENNLFIFDDENVRISPISKMPFRKKPYDSMNIVQICLWIIDSGCSKHMTGNRALLTNFVEKFLGTLRFGNTNFVMIAGYGDVLLDQ